MKHIFIALALIMLSAPAVASDKFLDIQEVTTQSGVKAWLVEDDSLPILSIQFTFLGAGSVNDPAEKQGLTQLLSNTLDEGAAHLDSQAFQKMLSDNSITLRFSASRDNFSGQLKTLSKNQDLAFDMLRAAITAPRFDEEAINRMRDANITRIKSSLSDPQWMAARIMNDLAFAGHPYAQNSGGTISTLQTIHSDDLRNAVKTRLAKNNLRIAVTGNIDAETLAYDLENIFQALPAEAVLKDIQKIDLQNTGQSALYTQDIPQSIISRHYPAFGRNDPDFYALRILNYSFGGGGFGSRLMQEIREERGLTYGIYSSTTDMRDIDTLSISTSTDNKNSVEMLDLIQVEVDKLLTDGLSEAEIINSKSYLIGAMPLTLTSSDQIASMILSLQTHGLPIDYLDNYAENINAVTADDINRAIKRIFETKPPLTIVVGKPEDYEPNLQISELPNVE